MTAQAGAPAKASAVEVAVLLALCPLAGIGAGLAFASVLIGLSVAAVGLIAVSAYALAANIDRGPRNLHEDSRRLSVTDISARRRGATRRENVSREEAGIESPSEPQEAPDVAPLVMTTVEPDRIVPFRMPSARP